MRWDTVEREMLVLGTQLHRVADTFMMLAKVLRDERESGTVGIYENGDGPAVLEQTRSDVGRRGPVPSEDLS